jgi:putative DNA primase/helicase
MGSPTLIQDRPIGPDDPTGLLLDRLRAADCDPRSTGPDTWESKCPAHCGSRHNLSIRRGDDGRALLHCHHEPGCQAEEITAAVGLSLANLFPNGSRRGAPSRKGKRKAERQAHATPEAALAGLIRKWDKPTAHWIYRRADGSEAFRVYRFDFINPETREPDKDYRPVHRTPAGWVLGDPRGKLPLYHLDELAAASVVYVHEGEKCADTVRGLGLVATTSSHGAKAPQKTDWTPLAGKEIIIQPDRGEEGEGYAQRVRGLLARLDPAPRVKVVRLADLWRTDAPIPEKGDVVEWVSDGVPDTWTDVECRAELERLADSTEAVDLAAVRSEDETTGSRNGRAGATKPEGDAEGRPQIEVSTERHVVVQETLRALARDDELFRRGATLGIVLQEEAEVADLGGGVQLAEARGSSRFWVLSEAMLGCHLTRNAEFFSWRTKGDEDIAVAAHPPDWLIRAIATRGHWPDVRQLRTIASCPYVRDDGSIPAPGYDASTETLYRPSIKPPALPLRPTRGDATEAANRLRQVTGQFPFASEFDWPVWLASLLTAIQRPAISGPVPGFAINGNRAGTGKGLLIDLVGIAVWGHPIPTRSYPGDPIEAGKVKLSLALACVPVVHFDNLPEGGFYGNSKLDSALTSTETEGRILGASRESGPVPLRPCWFLSGNNISPSKDAYRRWLPCNLKTGLENPHERSDLEVSDLRKHARDNRGDLIRDALTILAAHARSGRPRVTDDEGKPRAPLGSFEEWDRVVRGAVGFATGLDCLHTQRQTASEAPERLDKIALLEGWAELPGGQDRGLTTEEAIKLVTDSPERFATLHAAFMHLGKDGKPLDRRHLGYRLRGMASQNVGGWKFEKAGERNHTNAWKVTRA